MSTIETLTAEAREWMTCNAPEWLRIIDAQAEALIAAERRACFAEGEEARSGGRAARLAKDVDAQAATITALATAESLAMAQVARDADLAAEWKARAEELSAELQVERTRADATELLRAEVERLDARWADAVANEGQAVHDMKAAEFRLAAATELLRECEQGPLWPGLKPRVRAFLAAQPAAPTPEGE